MRTHLSCDVRCAMGSRWVESQCWLSLHWAPRGVFIVAKINKATVTKRPSPSQIQAQGYVRGHVRTCARAHSGASWQHTKSKEEEQKKKKSQNKRAHSRTQSDKSSRKTFSFWHAKTRAQLDHVLSRTPSYAHTPHKLSRTVTVQKGK